MARTYTDEFWQLRQEIENGASFVVHQQEKVPEIVHVFKNDVKYHLYSYTGKPFYGVPELVVEHGIKTASKNGLTFPILCDASSFYFNALNGLPGTLINHFEKCLNATQLYKLVKGFEDKSAYVEYNLGIQETKDSHLRIVRGALCGTIVRPKDPNAHGWEACFLPDNCPEVYSELPLSARYDMSAAKMPLRQMKTYLMGREITNYF